MAFCNTERVNSMKKFKTSRGLGASLLLFVALSPSISFSEDSVGGSCHLTQSGGRYTIVCEGVGDIETVYDYQTNYVYVIENCEQLKSDLLSSVDSLYSSYSQIQELLPYNENDAIQQLANDMQRDDEVNGIYISGIIDMASWSRDKLDSINTVCNTQKDFLKDSSSSNLYATISSIECGDCSSTGSGSNSCCDLSGVTSLLHDILDAINSAIEKLESISDDIEEIRKAVTGSLYLREQEGFHKQHYNESTNPVSYVFAADAANANIRNLLYNMQSSLAKTQASINNYLYYIKLHMKQGFLNSTNLLIQVTNYLSLSYHAQTNHFSFFREMSIQDSPMVDYMDYSSTMTRYEFLTNHYIRLTENSYADMTESEKSKTNWFSRVETLLAALVFQDAEQTNTVDTSYGEQDRHRIIDGLDGLESFSSSRLTQMNNVGRGMISVLYDLDRAFSSSIELPSEVNLVTLPDSSDSRSSSSITFQTSAIRNLVEVCHCATTLAWCFGGLWLFYLFVSWSVKTSYSLVVFCWSVVSGVFGGGK